jgi:tetratricopeptide (TPR) repeat protein
VNIKTGTKFSRKEMKNLAREILKRLLPISRTNARSTPLSGACHCALGKSLKRLGKISEGKEELRKATDLDPSYAPGWYELGVMLESDREFGGAVTAFEKFLELNQDAGQRKLVSDRIRSCKEHM